jgi:hypothetical protein
MNLCDVCHGPATYSSLVAEPFETGVHRFLCYVHAAEAHLLDVPVPTLAVIAEHAGYPLNAVIFVLEALVRAGLVARQSSFDRWRRYPDSWRSGDGTLPRTG